MERADGWPGLRDRYGLPQRDVRGLDHDLAYRALATDEIQATDLYSTDAEIRAYKLRVLRRRPRNSSRPTSASGSIAPTCRTESPRRFAALARLEGRINAAEMAAHERRGPRSTACPRTGSRPTSWRQKFGIESAGRRRELRRRRLLRRLGEHLALVAISLAAAIVVAIPLGIVAARRPRLGSVILAVAGVIQTIPSLALLVFMIPWLGIGAKPALVALFLYSLLPIVRNTATGLRDIPPSLRESAEALGLPPRARLLPDRVAAGLAGDPRGDQDGRGHQRRHRDDRRPDRRRRVRPADPHRHPPRRRLDDPLEGAIPAAVLALAVQGPFDLAERFLVPEGA